MRLGCPLRVTWRLYESYCGLKIHTDRRHDGLADVLRVPFGPDVHLGQSQTPAEIVPKLCIILN